MAAASSSSVPYDKKLLEMIGITVQSRMVHGKEEVIYIADEMNQGLGKRPSPGNSKGTCPSPGNSKGTRPSPDNSKGTHPLPGNSKGTRPSPGNSKGTRTSPGNSKGTRTSPGNSKGTRPSPDNSKGTHPSPDNSKGTHPSPDNSKGTHPSPPDDQIARCFLPDKDFFKVKGRPKRGDWLAEHKEPGQTYKQFQHCHKLHADRRHKTLYLFPITFFEDGLSDEILGHLKKFASIFFGMDVKVMKTTNLKGKVAQRVNDSIYQVHAGELLKVMQPLVPNDAFCVAGITMCDLYPRDSWNFVFGLADLGGRCGIYSLARYLSNFGENETSQFIPDRETDGMMTILYRACKTMCHEISHMFGLKHCVAFQCIMNGSNHLDESDSRPIFLCPLCLRKQHNSTKFDIVARYQEMETFWREMNRMKEADWLKRRIEHLRSS